MTMTMMTTTRLRSLAIPEGLRAMGEQLVLDTTCIKNLVA